MRSKEIEHGYVRVNHATPQYIDFIASTGLFSSIWIDFEHFDVPTAILAIRGWGTLDIERKHYLKVKSLGTQLVCPGGEVRLMLNGVRELAKTFQDPSSRLVPPKPDH